MKIPYMSQLAATILTAAFISTAQAAPPLQMGDMASDCGAMQMIEKGGWRQ